MTSKQLINKLCYEYNTNNFNEEKLKAVQQLKNDLEDFEWLKSKLNLVFLDTLNDPEDKIRVLKIMDVNYGEELKNGR